MSVIHVDESNFNTEVMESSIPIIMDFWASWCGPCHMMAPVFEELSSEYEGKLKFVKINTDEVSTIAGRYNIQGIPSLVIVKDGDEVDRIVGFSPKEVLKQRIDTVLAQAK